MRFRCEICYVAAMIKVDRSDVLRVRAVTTSFAGDRDTDRDRTTKGSETP